MASKCLFDNKLYPQAVFYLEQAVEKATKYLGLYNKIINEDEAKGDIRHKAEEIFVRVMEKERTRVAKFQEKLKIYPKLKNLGILKKYRDSDIDAMIVEINQFIDLLRKPRSFIPAEELSLMISELNKTEMEIEQGIKEIEPGIKIPEDIETIKKLMFETANQLKPMNIVSPEKIEEAIRELESVPPDFWVKALSDSLEFAIIYPYLVFLCSILTPHAVISRYPDSSQRHDPLTLYNEKHPLIMYFNQLAEITEKVLNRMRIMDTGVLPDGEEAVGIPPHTP